MADLIGLGKLSDNSLETIKMIYPDLAQPGVRKVGYALETVLDMANTILLPMKIANERSKLYFQKHMNVYQEKLNKVPEENIGIVPPEIGLSILDELLKVTNIGLADLFTSLLVNASTIDYSRYAHPSFINVIKSLSGDEAKIIKYLSNQSSNIIFIRFDKVDSGNIPLTRELSNLEELVELTFNENKAFYINNLINLGIIRSETIYYKDDISLYNDLESAHSEYLDYFTRQLNELKVENPGHIGRIHVTKGRYSITEFGKVFIKSISTQPELQNINSI